MKMLTFLFLLMFSVFAQAEIYKTIDEEGNVIFTDMKPRNTESEEVKLKPVTPIKSVTTRKPVARESAKPDNSKSYSEFKIIAPPNEATIRNKQRVSVKVSAKPRLLAGHKVRLLLDGKIIETKRSSSFTLENMERGTHTITVELLGSGSRVLKSSSNTIYIHQSIFTPAETNTNNGT